MYLAKGVCKLPTSTAYSLLLLMKAYWGYGQALLMHVFKDSFRLYLKVFLDAVILSI